MKLKTIQITFLSSWTLDVAMSTLIILFAYKRFGLHLRYPEYFVYLLSTKIMYKLKSYKSTDVHMSHNFNSK